MVVSREKHPGKKIRIQLIGEIPFQLKPNIFDWYYFNIPKVSSSYHLCVECFSQLSFDSEMYTKSATAADFVYIYGNPRKFLSFKPTVSNLKIAFSCLIV